MCEHAQRSGDPVVQQRRDDRAGQPEHDQQGGNVADDDVLSHVRDEHIVGERIERPDLNDSDEQDPGGE